MLIIHQFWSPEDHNKSTVDMRTVGSHNVMEYGENPQYSKSEISRELPQCEHISVNNNVSLEETSTGGVINMEAQKDHFTTEVSSLTELKKPKAFRYVNG